MDAVDIKQNIFHIEYYYQKNQGKMAAINNLMEHVNGDICFTCDSDDQLTVNCMDIIKKNAKKLLDDETVYALLFLKKVNKKKEYKKNDNSIVFDNFVKISQNSFGCPNCTIVIWVTVNRSK